jgi:hypothetical protein
VASDGAMGPTFARDSVASWRRSLSGVASDGRDGGRLAPGGRVVTSWQEGGDQLAGGWPSWQEGDQLAGGWPVGRRVTSWRRGHIEGGCGRRHGHGGRRGLGQQGGVPHEEALGMGPHAGGRQGRAGNRNGVSSPVGAGVVGGAPARCLLGASWRPWSGPSGAGGGRLEHHVTLRFFKRLSWRRIHSGSGKSGPLCMGKMLRPDHPHTKFFPTRNF